MPKAPKRKAAASQARLKAAKARSYKKAAAPSYGYSRTITTAAPSKSKSTTGAAKFPTGGVSLTGKTPTITKGPLAGAGVAQPGSRQKAAAVKQQAFLMAQGQRRRKKKSPAQAALVKSAMPKAKAQRSAAEIAAMHTYRANKRRKAKKTTRTLYGPKNFY